MGLMKNLGMTARGSRKNTLSITRMFFDRRAVVDAMDKATHTAMKRGAARIRTRAMRSMRYITAKPGKGDAPTLRRASRPGEPPLAVRPHPWVRKHLYFYYDPHRRQAVIGPLGFPTGTNAPNTLEFGGRARIRNKRRRRRKLGDGGELRIGGPASRTTKAARDAAGRYTGKMVTYARLRTAEQVRRANELNAQLYGPEFSDQTIAARPFMGPALKEELPYLSHLWTSSVQG